MWRVKKKSSFRVEQVNQRITFGDFTQTLSVLWIEKKKDNYNCIDIKWIPEIMNPGIIQLKEICTIFTDNCHWSSFHYYILWYFKHFSISTNKVNIKVEKTVDFANKSRQSVFFFFQNSISNFKNSFNNVILILYFSKYVKHFLGQSEIHELSPNHEFATHHWVKFNQM